MPPRRCAHSAWLSPSFARAPARLQKHERDRLARQTTAKMAASELRRQLEVLTAVTAAATLLNSEGPARSRPAVPDQCVSQVAEAEVNATIARLAALENVHANEVPGIESERLARAEAANNATCEDAVRLDESARRDSAAHAACEVEARAECEAEAKADAIAAHEAALALLGVRSTMADRAAAAAARCCCPGSGSLL